MEIRKTKPEELEEVLGIYAHGREIMKRTGNPTQWGNDRPRKELIVGDIEKGNSYVVTENGKICGVFAFIVGHDETYDYIEDGAWQNDDPYGTIHRIASDETAHGVLETAVDYCRDRVGELRIDTHKDNVIMRHLAEKIGFVRCGIIYVDDGTPRIAYQISGKRKTHG